MKGEIQKVKPFNLRFLLFILTMCLGAFFRGISLRTSTVEVQPAFLIEDQFFICAMNITGYQWISLKNRLASEK